MGRGTVVIGILVLVLLVVGVAVAVPRLATRSPGGAAQAAATRTAEAQPEEAQTYGTVPTSPAGPTAQAAQAAIPPGAHPIPQEETYKGCPPGGDGTDPELNTLKNRIDPVAAPAPMPFATLLNLPWPSAVNQRHMAQWAPGDRAQVAKSNGLGVTVEAYFIRVQAEGPESPNCHSTTDVDFHEWVVADPADDRTKAVVVEVGPRQRDKHVGWTLARFQQLAKDKARVRVTGWIMLDPEHPDQVDKTRGTIWEVHPATKIETFQGGQWVDIDTSR